VLKNREPVFDDVAFRYAIDEKPLLSDAPLWFDGASPLRSQMRKHLRQNSMAAMALIAGRRAAPASWRKMPAYRAARRANKLYRIFHFRQTRESC
jgi:hypothetical protein